MNFPDRASPSDVCFGAIEAGGSKFVCAIGTPEGALLVERRIETRDPQSTLNEVCQFFAEAASGHGRLAALGVGAFGPLELRVDSPTFGYITTTPKPLWSGTDLVGTLRRGVGCPVFLDTDVNAAALGEARWGAAQGLSCLAYMTVGTGVGVGVLTQGRPVHGLTHLEIGHTFVRRHPNDSAFAGACPYHADCLEGLASGTAIQARTGHSLATLPATDPMWEIEADYLGQLCALLVLCHSPYRIVIGGGVLHPRLYPRIQERMAHWLGGYIALKELAEERYIVAPGLGNASGVKGALVLALEGANLHGGRRPASSTGQVTPEQFR